MDPQQQRKLKLFAIGGIVLLVIVIVIVSLVGQLNKVTLTINVDGSGGGEYLYEIKGQSDKKTVDARTTKSTFERKVNKGNYEVVVSRGDASYVGIVSVNKDTNVKATLKAESGRKFVGINPAACMTMFDKVLLSRECTDPFYTKSNLHAPATNSLPSYLYDASRLGLGIYESSFSTDTNTYALFAVTANEEDTFEDGSEVKHYLYKLTTPAGAIAPVIQSKTEATGLDPARSYTIQPYKKGVIATTASYDNVWYIQDGAKPTKLPLQKPKTAGFVAGELTASQTAYLIVYNAASDQVDSEQPTIASDQTEVALYQDSGVRQYIFGSNFVNVSMCGAEHFCGINLTTDSLEVRSIKDNSLSYEITNATAYVASGEEVVIRQEDRILSINTSTGAGFVSYRFGKNSYCGLAESNSGYLLCVNDSKNKKWALRIDNRDKDTSIDQKINALNDISIIHDFNINNKFIYITTETDYVYDEASNRRFPDPKQVAANKKTVDDAIKAAGIDTSVYTIIYTIPNERF